MAYEKPLPRPNKEDRPFWEAAKEHRFVLPQCAQCAHRWFPPYISCPRCLSPNIEWPAASGKGTVWGFIEMHRPMARGFSNDVPYNVVMVELEEGPIMYSNIVGVPYEAIRVGMPVEVVFEDVSEEFAIPKFKPV